MQNIVLTLLLSSSAVFAARSHGEAKARATEARQATQRWDFTHIANPRIPDLIGSFDASQAAPLAHEYFSTSEWSDSWGIQSWSSEPSLDTPTRMTNSKNNFYISPNTDGTPDVDSWLSLRTARHDEFQSSAEVESLRHDYQYVTLKMVARVVGDAGACMGMFTYLQPDGGKVQEADLEILTWEENNVAHYTNQPGLDENGNPQPEATREVRLAAPWTTWQEHTLVWTPGSSDWYVNGEQVASIQFQAPVDPAIILFNAWSNGGEWSGNMAVGGSAELQIQWIEISAS